MYRTILPLLMLPLTLFGQILSLNGWEETLPEITKTDTDTLVVFDIDYTLVYPDNPAYQVRNVQKWKEVFEKQNWTKEEHFIAKMYIVINTPSRLISPLALEAFHHLKARDISAIALTASATGKWEATDCLTARIDMLKGLGFHFETTTPFKGDFVFENYPLPSIGSYPELKGGVIASNKASKGEVLKSFLALLPSRPKKVLAIDDLHYNLVDMEQACQEFNINFLGIELKGVHNLGEDLSQEVFEFEAARLHEIAKEKLETVISI